MNFSQAIKSSLIEKYATFKGRACRAEWWYFNLFIILVAIAVSVLWLLLRHLAALIGNMLQR